MNGHYVSLANRINQNLIDLDRIVKRTELLLNKAKQKNDNDYLDGVTLNLHSFYSGVESIFEDVARTMEKSIPSGRNWHQSLLLQMSGDINSIRPAVITIKTRHCLDEYRSFRHVVRNVYTFNLRPTRLEELVIDLPKCYQLLYNDLQKSSQFLERLTQDE